VELSDLENLSALNEDDDPESGQEGAPILPVAEDADAPIPALRDVRAHVVRVPEKAHTEPAGVPDAEDDGTVVVLEDPEGLAPKPIILSPAAYALAALFNGRRSARMVAATIRSEIGQAVAEEKILGFQKELDDALFLFSRRFEKIVRRQLRRYLDSDVRPAVHAGSAYPAKAEALQQTVASFFTAEDGPGDPWTVTPSAETPAGAPPSKPPQPVADTVRALIVPHIDLRVGGATYAHAHKELLTHCDADLFVILGVAHQTVDQSLYYVSQKDFDTPAGVVKTNKAIARHLHATTGAEGAAAELAHRTEHSVEFQAVLLATLLGQQKRSFEIVPVLCGPVEPFLLNEGNPLKERPFLKFTEALQAELEKSHRSWCMLCSVDFSHVGAEFGHSAMMTEKLLPPVARYDRRLLGLLERLDGDGFYREIVRTQNSRNVDAVMAALTMLQACQGIITKGRLLHYDQMLKPHTHSAVSYAAMAFER
jgi:AmmeMemoRadiSam system protein B